MKVITWAKKYKFELLLVVLGIVVFILIYNFIQSLKKDHSLDLVRQELKLKEDSRIVLEKERVAWFEVIKQKDSNITSLIEKDLVVQQSISELNNKIQNLSNKYNEKVKVINTFGSADLLEYFRNIPEQPNNDF